MHHLDSVADKFEGHGMEGAITDPVGKSVNSRSGENFVGYFIISRSTKFKNRGGFLPCAL